MSDTKHGLAVGRVVFGNQVVRGLTDRQANFITKLLNERIFDESKIPVGADNSINLHHARRVIEYLLSCPKNQNVIVPATEKQIAFAKSLIAKRVGGKDYENVDLLTIDRAEVSAIIDTLVNLPIKESLVLEVGAYRHKDIVYSVRKNVDNERRYAVTWIADVSGEFKWSERDYKIVHDINARERLSLKEAMEWGSQSGSCCHCGRPLTDPKSVATGIGAYCAKKYR